MGMIDYDIPFDGGVNTFSSGLLPHEDPAVNDLWLDPETIILYMYTDDGDSSQWHSVTDLMVAAGLNISEFGPLIDEVQANDTIMIHNESGDVSGHMPVSTLLGGWRDLRAPLIGAKSAGISDPTLKAFGPSGGIKQYAFNIGDEVFVAFHIDHDIKVGSTMYGHIHWSTDGTSTDSVKWEVEFMHASRNDIAHDTFPATTIVTLEASPQGSAWEHIVTEDAVGFIAPEIDTVLLAHLTRVSNGGTNNSDDVFGLFMDIHYETQQYGTKSRSPDFYS